MSLTHTIEPEFYDDERFSSIITLHYVNDCYENEISLCAYDDVDMWNNLIKNMKSGTEYHHSIGYGRESFSGIEVKDGNVNVYASIHGGNMNTNFKVKNEVFLPIAEKIRDEIVMRIASHMF